MCLWKAQSTSGTQLTPQLVRCLLGLFVATRKPEENPCGLQKVAEKGFMMRFVSFSVCELIPVAWLRSLSLIVKILSKL